MIEDAYEKFVKFYQENPDKKAMALFECHRIYRPDSVSLELLLSSSAHLQHSLIDQDANSACSLPPLTTVPKSATLMPPSRAGALDGKLLSGFQSHLC